MNAAQVQTEQLKEHAILQRNAQAKEVPQMEIVPLVLDLVAFLRKYTMHRDRGID